MTEARDHQVEVGRSHRLRSKRSEQSGLLASRKRKLRCLYALSDEGPQITFASLDAPPTTPAEVKFLEDADILQGRSFDEKNLQRRQLRSNTLRQRSPIRKVSPENRPVDTSRRAAKLQQDGPRTRKSRANTPGSRSDAGHETARIESDGMAQGQLMRRSISKGSQTELPAEETAVLDEIIEETFDHATHQQPQPPDDPVPPGGLETEKARSVESPPGSPGADPRRVMPITAEDAVELAEPLVQVLSSPDTHHKAATVHLPPKEVQERHLREARKARGQKEHLSINLPPRDGGRTAEPLSSPGSTIDAHSATTPALHDASTDTSPDNESSRYEPERLEKDDDLETPIEFRKTPEEVAQKERHDRILKAQEDISSAEILRGSSNGANDQLRMEDQAASGSDQQPQHDDSAMVDGEDNMEGRESSDGLTQQASGVVRDVVEDEEEVVDAATEDVAMSGVDEPVAEVKDPSTKQSEVADSKTKEQTPVADAMNVDATVQDSFESNATVESRAGTSPVEARESVASSGTDSKKSSATPAASTPRRNPSTPAGPPPPLERMTTRVQSGAIRQKSVSDILSEIDRPNTTPSSERSGLKGATESELANSHSPSRSETPQSPGTRMRSLVEKAKDRERSKLSTVIFPKDKPRPNPSSNALVPSSGQSSRDTNGDYFMPLFLATASTDKRGVPSLDNLLQTAHKTITTSNAYIPINENQTAKVLRRIYNLQSSGKWSLRQPKRQVEPARQSTHWDVLLHEAKWMRTDFREERKWKMTVARNLAYACAEWVECRTEDRKVLQVNATRPKPAVPETSSSKDTEMIDELHQEPLNQTPDLIASGDFDSLDEFDEEPRLNLVETVAPTAIFTLQDDDVVFGLRKSPTTDRLLNELPMYGAPLVVPSADSLDPDRFWKKRALPLSKYVEGRMELKSSGPPRKKSRYEYEEEDDDDDHVVFGEQGSKRPILPPEKTDVALFDPEHKHTRDRIHAGHQFRPPSEYTMPPQSFFECRTASQWTWAEDDDLKAHVREYSYNWSLISSMLSSRSLFSSGAERRSPWECFERWISLEGLPADMQKTHYFRAYNSRMEAANRNVSAQAAQAPQQVNGQGVLQPPRRRSTISFRVDRRRQQKHLTLVDAMRKLAKKRETSIQKQQHAAGLAAMRKAQEVPQPRAVLNTPQDFSRLKFEREERMKEQMQLFQQRQEAQRRAAMQARIAGQNPQQALPNGATPQQRGPTPAGGALPPNGTPTQTSQNLTVPGQNRARGPMPPQMAGQVQMPNGLRLPQPMMNGVPQAQMQNLQGGQLPMPNPALDVGLVARAQNISEQQRQAIRMQQAGQIPMQGQNGQIHNSPPRNMNAMSPPNFSQMSNGNMLPFNLNNANGVSSPGPSPSQVQAGSPRMGQLQQLSNGMVPQALRLEESLRQKFPNATQEQIMRMISDAVQKNAAHQRAGLAQSAMNAAAGGNMNGMANGQGMANMNGGQGQSPQLYAQMLRQQQEAQQKQAQAAAQAQAAQAQAQAVQSQQGNSGQGHQRSGSATSGK